MGAVKAFSIEGCSHEDWIWMPASDARNVDFFPLLVSNFNPRLCRLKIYGNMHIFMIEFDVEEILRL